MVDAQRYRIHGMDCAEEVSALRRSLEPVVADLDRLSFDVLAGTMTVQGAVASDAVLNAVKSAGMRGEIITEDPPLRVLDEGHAHATRTSLTLLSGLLAAGGFLTHAALAGGVDAAIGREGLGQTHDVPLPTVILYTLAIIGGAWNVAPKAFSAARRLRPDMNLLMTIAVIGAVFLGEWFEAATVSFLFALSLTLESWSVGRARRAVAALLDLSPPRAWVKDPSGELRSARVEDVDVGQRFIVRAGDRVPLDGVVKVGDSQVNQAPITGESVPVPKGPGNEVFAGTINGDGVLEVESSRRSGDTTLARIIRLVRDARAGRATSEQWVERFARVYTPVVMAIAAAMLVLPPMLGMGSWSEWLYRSLVLLVIACPCALVISTPVSIVSGLAAAARAGALIKGGIYLEIPAKLRTIAFDKTGTLTRGQLTVEKVVALSGHSEEEVLQRAAALEAQNSHPLATAIVSHARERGITIEPACDALIVPGRGVRGRFRDSDVWLGSHRFLEEQGREPPEVHDALVELAASGNTVVVVGEADHVCGLIAMRDVPRKGAREVIRRLETLGIPRIVMLTGDNRPTAEAIAEMLAIGDVQAELLPPDKVAVIEELARTDGPVAMVGDGVNDAPAMARADLGIAMGAAGSDAAIETADIALMSDDLSRIPWLVLHSRRTVSVIRQNIGFSLLVKTTFVLLAFAGRATLWSAIAADIGASLLVVFNGLRLLSAGKVDGRGHEQRLPS